MHPFLQIALSNVAVAAALAVVIALVTRVWKNRHVAHVLWLLVLVKLVTPPLWHFPVSIGSAASEPDTALVEEHASLSAPISASIHEQSPPAAVNVAVTDTWQPAVDVIPSLSPALPGNSPHITETAATASRPSVTAPIDWSLLVLRCWIATSALWLVVAALRIGRFHRLVRRSPPADADLRQRVEELARRLGRGIL